MSQISGRAAVARENARQSDGKFGSYQLPDAGTDADLDLSFLEGDDDCYCTACGRPSLVCSKDPCEDVWDDRLIQEGETTWRDAYDELYAKTGDLKTTDRVFTEIERREIGNARFSDDGVEHVFFTEDDKAKALDMARFVQGGGAPQDWEDRRGTPEFNIKAEKPLDKARELYLAGGHDPKSVAAALAQFDNDEYLRRMPDGSLAHVAPETPEKATAISNELHRMGQYKHQNNSTTEKVREGSNTPWGKAQHVEHPVPGVAVVSCAGHGGIKLSPGRNRDIPAALRNDSGWYEEDAESHIVGMYHPEALSPNYLKRVGIQGAREESEKSVRQWFPDQYEKATGKMVPAGESPVKDERIWREQHAQDMVAVSATMSSEHPGMVEVTLARGGRVAEGKTWDETPRRKILVPQEDYDDAANKHACGSYRGAFVADPSKGYRDITPPEMANPVQWSKPKGYTGVAKGKTAAAQARIEKDLSKQYRGHDGRVYSVEDKIKSGQIDQKKAWFDPDTGRITYELWESTGKNRGYSYKVSKATYEAFEAPEQRSQTDMAREKMQAAALKVRDIDRKISDEMRRPGGNVLKLKVDQRKAREAAEEAQTAYEALRRQNEQSGEED